MDVVEVSWARCKGDDDEVIFSGALKKTDAHSIARRINSTNPAIDAKPFRGLNYGGFYEVQIGDAALFKSAFPDVRIRILDETPDQIKPTADRKSVV